MLLLESLPKQHNHPAQGLTWAKSAFKCSFVNSSPGCLAGTPCSSPASNLSCATEHVLVAYSCSRDSPSGLEL